MPRFSDQQLLGKALQAIEAVYERAERETVEPSAGLRFILAWLARDAPERWSFDSFWTAATRSGGSTYCDEFGRRQTLRAAINGIYVQLGLRRG